MNTFNTLNAFNAFNAVTVKFALAEISSHIVFPQYHDGALSVISNSELSCSWGARRSQGPVSGGPPRFVSTLDAQLGLIQATASLRRELSTLFWAGASIRVRYSNDKATCIILVDQMAQLKSLSLALSPSLHLS